MYAHKDVTHMTQHSGLKKKKKSQKVILKELQALLVFCNI